MINQVKIEMLSTGDEVLYGQITDTNASWLSDFLFQQGFLMSSRFTVGDDLNQLIDALQQRTKFNDVLIVNGGLGPTSDDLSAEAAAKANHEELVLCSQWLTEMETFFSSRGRTMPPANIKQAMLPKSATMIDNPVGTACGFKMELNGCLVFFTPGVPSEFKEMVKAQILPAIQHQFPSINKPICYRLTTMGRTESDLATEIDSKLTVPAGISVGYRSAMPIIELKLTGDQVHQVEMDQLWDKLKGLVADNTLYEGENKLANVVSQLLHDSQQSIVVFEQHTAGLMAYQLHDADAPISKSAVIADSNEIERAIKQTRNEDPNVLILALYDFDRDEGTFKLVLSTPTQDFCYQLKYTSRRYSKAGEQAIFSAIGHDTVRRYLSEKSPLGPNVWLTVISQ